jgi:hypothetical protein
MKSRPAESVTGVTALGMLLALILGVDDPTIVGVMVGVLGLLPAAVTLLVANGGVIGVVKLLVLGRR